MSSIAHLIHVYGLLVVAGCIGLEGIGFPVPGETSLIIASAIAGNRHDLNIVEVILTATAAATIGRVIGYYIGREFGYWLLLRYGCYWRLTESRIKLGQYLFLRHGGKIVIVAQFIPILRALAGILAGANRMPRGQFLLANVVGALLWATFFGVVAYSLGRQIENVATPMVWILGIAALIVIIIIGNFIRGHEVQLEAEAEKALPGPLEFP